MLKEGIVPRREVKREFYDQGKLITRENQLDIIWTSFMEETFNPNSKSLGRKNKTTKEKKPVMKEQKKRGPKPRKIQYMDDKFEKVIKTFDSLKDAADHFSLNEKTLRVVLSKPDEEKIDKDYKQRFRYVPKIAVSKKPKVTIDKKTVKDDGPSEEFHDKLSVFEDDYKDLYEDDSEGSTVTRETIPYRQQLLNKLDDARTEYIEALKNYAICVVSEYGIELEKKDINLCSFLDEEVK